MNDGFLPMILSVLFLCFGIAGFDDDVRPEHYKAAERLCADNGGIEVITGHGLFGAWKKQVKCQNGAQFSDISAPDRADQEGE